jgi:hypothetical protein
MHSQLINMDLQEGMVIKSILYIHLHLHAPKHLRGAMYLTNIYVDLV